ncbi:ABC transporter permease [Bacillus taeanensis]|uniref:ABC transporter permease n=1 Tax=Bacillus taeanensis TaxID=273032 RepID=A0A366XPY0_9BACI|nr:ABC transporter permease [Bacillus taeanensis]RBW68172.1 ABC transporter permease [Bacillus taeanensis]
MRILTLIKRLVKQLFYDKRTLALLFAAPLLIFSLLNFVFSSPSAAAVIDLTFDQEMLSEKLSNTDAVVNVVSLEEAKNRLLDGETDAYLEGNARVFTVTLEGSDPTANQAVMNVLKSLAPQQIEVNYLHGSDRLETIDYFAPALIGFFVFFFVFLISGVAFLRERTSGTLERMLASPLKRYEIVLGYFFGFGIFAILQTILVQWFAISILDIYSEANFFSVLLVNSLLAAVALSLGSFLSTFAKNEFQMVQFIPIVILPQILLCGLFDLRNMPGWILRLADVLPLTYAADALRGLMIRGESLTDVSLSLLVLVGFASLFLIGNVLLLRK